jgi:hypothetical protein
MQGGTGKLEKNTTLGDKVLYPGDKGRDYSVAVTCPTGYGIPLRNALKASNFMGPLQPLPVLAI